jgi:pimeloyl-ACP methyl ester carboxylesterase
VLLLVASYCARTRPAKATVMGVRVKRKESRDGRPSEFNVSGVSEMAPKPPGGSERPGGAVALLEARTVSRLVASTSESDSLAEPCARSATTAHHDGAAVVSVRPLPWRHRTPRATSGESDDVASSRGIIRRMRAREETIRVDGVDVHAWVGGRGEPVLVLHGAGGNRGFTRSTARLAERYTVWAPTHPGFGQSGDAEWMEGIDDLARFYLWFIDAAEIGRPHLIGHSIGGWTAAEMAVMSPASLGRLVLVAPAGLKPETGEILDIFYHPLPALRDLMVHDPASIPEWDELFGRPPTPTEQEVAQRNREMAARLTWKPYMHDPRLPHFLPRVTNRALIVWGRQDRLVPLVCGEQYRKLLLNATLAVLEGCGHLPPIEQPDAYARLVLDFLGAP